MINAIQDELDKLMDHSIFGLIAAIFVLATLVLIASLFVPIWVPYLVCRMLWRAWHASREHPSE